ncbi:MAG: hypothetical protein BWK78_01160 [Thiotrichaceae bacterium IS1]|nr:MAG: hypothetical protein BWK78_01160 [Thiotrichaceae bacterium IS1]
MNAINLGVILTLAVILLWLSFTKPKVTLLLAIFLTPWTIDFDVGLRVTVFQIVLVALLVTLFLKTNISRSSKANTPIRPIFIIFMVYAVFWSIVQIPFLPEAQVTGGGWRSPVYRALFQIPQFFLTLLPIFVVPRLFHSQRDLISAGRIYIQSAVTLAIIGWMQVLIWFATGWNPIPGGWSNSLLSGTAVRESLGTFNLAGLTIMRMSSFGGEPKGLGQGLTLAVLLIQTIYLIDKKAINRRIKFIWFFLIVSTFMTMSSSAFLVWFIGTLVLLVFGSAKPLFSSSSRTSKITSYLAILFLFILIVIPIITYDPDKSSDDNLVSGLIYERTVGRGIVEDYDDAVISYLREHPLQTMFGVGLGNIHLYADAYLAPEILHYAAGAAFVAKSGYLRLISELGIIGLVIFVYWTWRQKKILDRTISKNSLIQSDLLAYQILSVFVLIALFAFLARGGYIAPQFYITLGLCVAARTMLFRDHHYN